MFTVIAYPINEERVPVESRRLTLTNGTVNFILYTMKIKNENYFSSEKQTYCYKYRT